MTAPVQATASGGRVVITCDPATARDLGQAFAKVHADDRARSEERPRWYDDVISIFIAAANADIQSGRIPEVAEVPLVRRGAPLLLVVGGEDRC